MWTGKEKILGQKVNVKFFAVGLYVPLALVRQTILKTRVLAKYIWNINKRPNPKKINSLKDYMVDSHFLMSFDFFGFFCIFYDFLKKTHTFVKKIRTSVVGFERPQKIFSSRFVNFPAICDTFPMLENSRNNFFCWGGLLKWTKKISQQYSFHHLERLS